MSGFAVSTEQFAGPLSLLLELIEAEKLDISQVSLGQVTEAYLRHIEVAEGIGPEELTDFLLIASKLVLIKSRLLLPELPEVEEQGPSLEQQLQLYRTYVEATKWMAAMLQGKRTMFGHEKLPVCEPRFVPPEKFGLTELQETMLAILRKMKPSHQLPRAALEPTVSIQEKILEFREMLARVKKISFGQMLSGARNRTEMVVCLLALLELVKGRAVAVEQSGTFGDIRISMKV